MPGGSISDSGPGFDAASPAPIREELSIELRFAALDGGLGSIAFSPGTKSIDPTDRLELTSNLPLRNVRVRLFDEADRVLPSEDESLIARTDASVPSVGPLRYRVHLLSPLKPGRRYVIVLDAESGDGILDERGEKVPDQRVELAVNGVREKPTRLKKHKRRRR